MSPIRSIRILMTANAIEYLALRFTQIALPLVVLRELGSAGAAGLVGGLAGLPVVTSPWWARRLRQRLHTGRRLALVSLWQAGAVLLVPVGLTAGLFHPVLLGLVGLAVGVSAALGGPGRIALLSDLGDELGDGASTRVVTWDDVSRRAAMVVGPALAGVGVHLGWAGALLWVEGGALVLSALLVSRAAPRIMPDAAVIGRGRPSSQLGAMAAPGILESVRAHPDVVRGWVMRGTSCLLWFAFALGLAVLGERTGQSGTLYATGLTAYGIGSLLMTLVLAPRRPSHAPIRLATIAWTGQGIAFATMSFSAQPLTVALCAASAGVATVVGIRAMTQVLLRQTSGPARRAALAGQSILVEVTVSAGMLGGGLLLDAFGPQPVLLASGLVTAGVALLAGAGAASPGAAARVPDRSPARDDAAAPPCRACR